MEPTETLPVYEVTLSNDATDDLGKVVSKAILPKMLDAIELLATMPEMGKAYDPEYPAVVLPFEMRVLYLGVYGLYYVLERDQQKVRVLFIEDQRSDPLQRFRRR